MPERVFEASMAVPAPEPEPESEAVGPVPGAVPEVGRSGCHGALSNKEEKAEPMVGVAGACREAWPAKHHGAHSNEGKEAEPVMGMAGACRQAWPAEHHGAHSGWVATAKEEELVSRAWHPGAWQVRITWPVSNGQQTQHSHSHPC